MSSGPPPTPVLTPQLLPWSRVFLESDVSDVEPYKVKGLLLDEVCAFFFFLILLTLLIHQEENTGTLVEFRISGIGRIALFVSKKGTIPPFLW